MLPVPRIPPNLNPSSTVVSAAVGPKLAQPLVELEAAYREAEAAVAVLESCRPGSAGVAGGAAWQAAVAADVEAAAAGERPKARAWKTAALLAGEPVRWAHARAMAGAVGIAAARTAEALDRGGIAAAAGNRADSAAQRWAKAARIGWETREDALRAWEQVRAGQSDLEAFAAARAVLEWAEGTGPGRPDTAVQIPYTNHLPDDRVGRGYWLALELHLNPDTTWLSFPQDVDWPDDVGDIVTNAFPESGARFTALSGHGVFERTR